MQACLLTPYAGPHDGGLLLPWRVEEKELILWATKYIDHDVWSQSAVRKGLWRDGNVVTDEDLLPQDELRASVFYKEFLSSMGVARFCAGAIFAGAPGLPATCLSVYRAPNDPPFGRNDREFMRLQVPHLSRSLGLMHRLGLAPVAGWGTGWPIWWPCPSRSAPALATCSSCNAARPMRTTACGAARWRRNTRCCWAMARITSCL